VNIFCKVEGIVKKGSLNGCTGIDTGASELLLSEGPKIVYIMYPSSYQ